MSCLLKRVAVTQHLRKVFQKKNTIKKLAFCGSPSIDPKDGHLPGMVGDHPGQKKSLINFKSGTDFLEFLDGQSSQNSSFETERRDF